MIIKCSFRSGNILPVWEIYRYIFRGWRELGPLPADSAFPPPAYSRSLLTGVIHLVFTLRARRRALSQSVRLTGEAVDIHKLFFFPLSPRRLAKERKRRRRRKSSPLGQRWIIDTCARLARSAGEIRLSDDDFLRSCVFDVSFRPSVCLFLSRPSCLLDKPGGDF